MKAENTALVPVFHRELFRSRISQYITHVIIYVLQCDMILN